MATKIYKLTSLQAAKINLKFLGTTINGVNFTPGHGGHNFGNGEFVTSDPFIQDALEADERFGTLYTLKKTYGTPAQANNEHAEQNVLGGINPEPVRKTRRELEAEARAKAQTQEAEQKPKPESKKTTGKKQTAKKDAEQQNTDAKEFANVNDAVYYLEENLGLEVTDTNFETLCKENNIIVKA